MSRSRTIIFVIALAISSFWIACFSISHEDPKTDPGGLESQPELDNEGSEMSESTSDKGVSHMIDITELGIFDFHNLTLESADVSSNVVIIVITRWNAYEARKSIRNSFAQFHQGKNFTYTTLFLFGFDEQVRKEAMLKLRYESRTYGDLLVPEVEDNYHTVAMKLLAAFHWISNNLPNVEWIVKADDDVILNMLLLDDYLSKADASNIHCKVMSDRPVMRSPTAKWYISKMEYKLSTYPKYCLGPTYIMSRATIDLIFNAFCTSFKTDYIWIEDVYLTGILAERIGIAHADFSFHLKFNQDNLRFISALVDQISVEERAEKWHELFDNKSLDDFL